MQTVFKKVDYTLSGLLHFIEIGDIGLPDIQRPFVWSAAKVRDLFDSMYRGFPVGYLLFWSNAHINGVRQIGLDTKGHSVPTLLIVDGQQRLTSLYSVFRGKLILDENYQQRRLEIAFRPRDGRFEVSDAAIKRDPEFIPDISNLWASGKSSRKLVNDFVAQLKEKRPLSDDEEEIISHNLDRLFDIQKYPFTALEIAHTVDEEQVADIFVRINSEGVKLNQADFILTLLSVFAEDLRVELEQFSRASRFVPQHGGGPSPYNHFIQVSPDQLLRVGVALGFYRARLRSVYQILRSKDPVTGEFLAEHQESLFNTLRESQKKVLNLTLWHQYFSALLGAGFKSWQMISSANALLYSYAFYLMGKTRFGVPSHELDKLIGRWFYAVTLSGRYTNSPETVMESDLNLVKDLPGGEAFVATLNKVIHDTLTGDFWAITLPNELDTSSARSPALFAYYAAQNLLQAPVLFSKKRIPDLLDPALQTKKKPLERHHLFPRGWLEKKEVTDLKLVNQAANFALLEWPDNINISDTPPFEYLPDMRSRFTGDEWERMCRLHALWEGWENLPYDEFLIRRRGLMAEIIRQGFESLQ
jgi:hypothetical protein